MEMGQGGPGNSPAPSGTGCSLPVWGEGLTAAYVQYIYEQGRGMVGSRVSCFWFLHMCRLEEVVMTSLRTREGLSPAVSANAFVTSSLG